MRQFPKLASIEVDVNLKDQVVLSYEGKEIAFNIVGEGEVEGEEMSVECAGVSTSSKSADDSSWHLGSVRCVELVKVGEWLSPILNSIDSAKMMKKEKTKFKLVRAVGSRKVANFAGSNSAPFDPDVQKQKEGLGSPFKFGRLPIEDNDR